MGIPILENSPNNSNGVTNKNLNNITGTCQINNKVKRKYKHFLLLDNDWLVSTAICRKVRLSPSREENQRSQGIEYCIRFVRSRTSIRSQNQPKPGRIKVWEIWRAINFDTNSGAYNVKHNFSAACGISIKQAKAMQNIYNNNNI